MKKLKFPHSHVAFNTRDYLSDSKVLAQSWKERGRMLDKIAQSCADGDAKALTEYSFLGRYSRLSTAEAPRPPIPLQTRREVLSAGVCAHCCSSYRLEIDHIVPYSRCGTHDRKNLQALCMPCNRKKGDSQ